jgi:hypothetical protein
MSAWERELGELPSPIESLFDRKVGQGLYVFPLARHGHSVNIAPIGIQTGFTSAF